MYVVFIYYYQMFRICLYALYAELHCFRGAINALPPKNKSVIFTPPNRFYAQISTIRSIEQIFVFTIQIPFIYFMLKSVTSTCYFRIAANIPKQTTYTVD